MTTQKQGLQVKLDEKGNPIAILFRTKEGYWVWYSVSSMTEEEQVALMENQNEIKQNNTTK